MREPIKFKIEWRRLVPFWFEEAPLRSGPAERQEHQMRGRHHGYPLGQPTLTVRTSKDDSVGRILDDRQEEERGVDVLAQKARHWK